MLQTEDLHVAYGKIQAVRGLTLSVEDNELVAIVGANGAGKTTLLNAIMGLKGVQSGRIRFADREIASLASWKRAALGMSIVPEGGRIFTELTVERNLLLGAYRQSDKSRTRQRMHEVYELFPVLEERKGQSSGTLSGGERQMLAIGRALMNEPSLLLVDEISMGLMPKLVTQVFETVLQLKKQGISVLLAEQNAQEALSIADRALVLENGQVTMEGLPQELVEDDGFRRAYLGV